jgi:hypothetical protein
MYEINIKHAINMQYIQLFCFYSTTFSFFFEFVKF